MPTGPDWADRDAAAIGVMTFGMTEAAARAVAALLRERYVPRDGPCPNSYGPGPHNFYKQQCTECGAFEVIDGNRT